VAKVRLVLVVPIPEKDREDRPVSRKRRQAVLKRLLKALGSWFGSATALPSWGSWKEGPDAPLSIDRGQAVVLVLTRAGQYRRRRAAMRRLLQAAGRELDQAQMAVIAFQAAKGSLLIRC
jgi:hypothetical protein